MKKAEGVEELDVLEVERRVITVAVLGRTPLIMNRLAEKARQQLLFPPPPKTRADKQAHLKHEPLREFRDSTHRIPDEACATLLGMPTVAFKAAMRTAALEMPGVSKAQIGRLVFIEGLLVPVYGIPQIHSTVVRMSDPGRTPDIRTRCIVPEWACYVSVSFLEPHLRAKTVGKLLAAAGFIAGVGDWRSEKGSGNYGQFEIVGEDNAEFQGLIANGGRAAQVAALNDPVPFDIETQELLSWFDAELDRRGYRKGDGDTVNAPPAAANGATSSRPPKKNAVLLPPHDAH
jgi:hypothetical protein